MKIKSLIEELTSFEPEGAPFLSLYLDARPTDNGRDAYMVWYKKQASELDNQEERDGENSKQLAGYLERISEFLESEVDASANGVAVFCSDTLFETVQLDVPFQNNRLIVSDRPHLLPLVRLREQNPPYAVLWTDTNKADIYIFGGERDIDIETESENKVKEIENEKTNRSQVGGWSQARYQRHVENFHLQHAKDAVATLERIMKKNGVNQLILCGDETTIMPILKPELSKEMEESIAAVLPMAQYASESEIREATAEAIAAYHAEREAEVVERVFNAARAAAGLGTLGMDKTLEALSNGQVEEVVLAADPEAIRYNTKSVENVLEAYAPGDDNSGDRELPETSEKRQIIDEVIVRAINSAAKIVFVEDASLLDEACGIGAVFRYNFSAAATTTT